MNITKSGIGGRIKHVRRVAGLNQQELGEKFGVGKQAISHYENGAAYPNPEFLAAIAEIGNVTLDWLITGKGDAAQEVTRDDALREVMRAVITGDAKLLDQVRDAAGEYAAKGSPEEQQLLITFRKLGRAEQEKVLEIARLYAGEREG